MKIGIHSENHICSLEVMRELLKEYFTNAEVEMIDRARRSRIDCQYYTSGDVPDVLLAAMITDVPRFLVSGAGLSQISLQVMILQQSVMYTEN